MAEETHIPKKSKDLHPATVATMKTVKTGHGSDLVFADENDIPTSGLARLQALRNAPVVSSVDMMPLSDLDKMIDNRGEYHTRYARVTKDANGSWNYSQVDKYKAQNYAVLTDNDVVNSGRLEIERGNEKLIAMACLKDHYDLRKKKQREENSANTRLQSLHETYNTGFFKPKDM